MKIVFLEDVPRVARAGETKEVANGYARNFLIPRKLAVPVGAQAMDILAARHRHQEQTFSELGDLAGHLEGQEVILRARAGAKERLHGSVTSADIAAALEKSTGIAVDRRKIELAEPIHQLGSYEVAIRLAKDIVPKIRVKVTEEGAE